MLLDIQNNTQNHITSQPSTGYCQGTVVGFDSLCLSQQVFSHAGTGLPVLSQWIKFLAQGHMTMTPPAVKLEVATL